MKDKRAFLKEASGRTGFKRKGAFLKEASGRTGFKRKGAFLKEASGRTELKIDRGGFELGISTLILMILGVLLLAALIVFFSMGSGNFLDNIKMYFSYSNVDSVVTSFNLFADSNIIYRYCCEKNKVRYYVNGEKKSGSFTCNGMLNESFANNLKEMNCDGTSC